MSDTHTVILPDGSKVVIEDNGDVFLLLAKPLKFYRPLYSSWVNPSDEARRMVNTSWTSEIARMLEVAFREVPARMERDTDD